MIIAKSRKQEKMVLKKNFFSHNENLIFPFQNQKSYSMKKKLLWTWENVYSISFPVNDFDLINFFKTIKTICNIL